MIQVLHDMDKTISMKEWWILSDNGEPMRVDVKRYVRLGVECVDEI